MTRCRAGARGGRLYGPRVHVIDRKAGEPLRGNACEARLADAHAAADRLANHSRAGLLEIDRSTIVGKQVRARRIAQVAPVRSPVAGAIVPR